MLGFYITPLFTCTDVSDDIDALITALTLRSRSMTHFNVFAIPAIGHVCIINCEGTLIHGIATYHSYLHVFAQREGSSHRLTSVLVR